MPDGGTLVIQSNVRYLGLMPLMMPLIRWLVAQRRTNDYLLCFIVSSTCRMAGEWTTSMCARVDDETLTKPSPQIVFMSVFNTLNSHLGEEDSK